MSNNHILIINFLIKSTILAQFISLEKK